MEYNLQCQWKIDSHNNNGAQSSDPVKSDPVHATNNEHRDEGSHWSNDDDDDNDDGGEQYHQ